LKNGGHGALILLAAEGAGDMGAKRILVIEDDAGIRGLLRDILEEAGFAVVAVSDAAEAFSPLSQDIDLVLLDLVMPEAVMDGFAFLANARARPELATTPVVVLSGLGESIGEAIDPSTARALHIVSIVAKPIDISSLLSVVREAVHADDRS
jgi:CheY-like chemotaxis protein